MNNWLFAENQDGTSEGWEDSAIKNFKGNPLKNLAREIIQNSLDAPRDADEDMADILESEVEKGAFKGVLHCFSSGARLAERALAIGFYISFSGILTFNKSEELRQIAKNVPLDRLLVETDSPYLAPPPHRGKTNEPGFTRYVVNCLAEVKGLDEAEMAALTRKNTLALFDKMQPKTRG